MKLFFTRLFMVIGILFTVVMLISAMVAYGFARSATKPPKAPDNMILSLDFNNPVVERQSDFRFGLSRMLVDDARTEMPLLHIVRALEKAKDDPRVKGVVAIMGSEPPVLAHAQEISTAIDTFRAKGKFSAIFAPSYGDFAPGAGAYYLASRFDQIWLQPVGSVGITPYAIEAPFGKTAFNKFGVDPDFMRREEYKSFSENLSRDNFSPAVRANMQAMVDNLTNQIAQGLSVGRKLEPAKARSLLNDGPYTAQEALKLGLVTKLGYSDEIEAEIKAKAGKDAAFVDPSDYMFYLASEQDNSSKKKAKIALIYADGMITDKKLAGPARLAQDETIDTNEIVTAFEDAVQDKEIKGIVFRVNSPGGSPVASETIRRAIVKAKEKKPVYVSMGRMAASGGYWISMNGSRVFADPATLTGSIGVVAGKFVLGGLFDKIGVKWDTVASGADDNTGMWSPRAPFNAKARARMDAMLDETYKNFTDNVAAARKIPAEKMPDVAKGRVFTGEQALQAGLVDQLGGLNETIESLKAELKFKPEDKVAISELPAPQTPASIVLRLFQNFGHFGSMLGGTMQQWQAAQQAFAPYLQTILPNQSVQATMPVSFSARGL